MKKFIFVSLLLMAGLCTQLHANQNSCEVSASQNNVTGPTFFIGVTTFSPKMPEFHYKCTVELSNYERIEFNLAIASKLYVNPTGGQIEFTIDHDMMMHRIYEPYKEQGYYEMLVPIRGNDYYDGTHTLWPTISRTGIIRIILAD